MKKSLLVLAIIILVLIVSNIKQERLEVIYVEKNTSNVKQELIYAIIDQESNWKPKIISKKGAIGLMQVRYSVWGDKLKEQGIIKHRADLFKPDKNIKAGTFILDTYIEKEGNIHDALVSYSGGDKKYPYIIYRKFFERQIKRR